MKYKYLLLIMCILFAGFIAGEFVNAQTNEKVDQAEQASTLEEDMSQRKDWVKFSEAQREELAKYNKMFKSLVKEYGEIIYVDKCSPRSLIYSDCDYRIHTQFVDQDTSKEPLKGYIPAFSKNNDVYVKDGVIVKVDGVGKRSEFYKQK